MGYREAAAYWIPAFAGNDTENAAPLSACLAAKDLEPGHKTSQGRVWTVIIQQVNFSQNEEKCRE